MDIEQLLPVLIESAQKLGYAEAVPDINGLSRNQKADLAEKMAAYIREQAGLLSEDDLVDAQEFDKMKKHYLEKIDELNRAIEDYRNKEGQKLAFSQDEINTLRSDLTALLSKVKSLTNQLIAAHITDGNYAAAYLKYREEQKNADPATIAQLAFAEAPIPIEKAVQFIVQEMDAVHQLCTFELLHQALGKKHPHYGLDEFFMAYYFKQQGNRPAELQRNLDKWTQNALIVLGERVRNGDIREVVTFLEQPNPVAEYFFQDYLELLIEKAYANGSFAPTFYFISQLRHSMLASGYNAFYAVLKKRDEGQNQDMLRFAYKLMNIKERFLPAQVYSQPIFNIFSGEGFRLSSMTPTKPYEVLYPETHKQYEHRVFSWTEGLHGRKGVWRFIPQGDGTTFQLENTGFTGTYLSLDMVSSKYDNDHRLVGTSTSADTWTLEPKLVNGQHVFALSTKGEYLVWSDSTVTIKILFVEVQSRIVLSKGPSIDSPYGYWHIEALTDGEKFLVRSSHD